MLSYAATQLVEILSEPCPWRDRIVSRLRQDKKRRRQLLLLLHLYAQTDVASLRSISALLCRRSLPISSSTIFWSFWGTTAALSSYRFTQYTLPFASRVLSSSKRSDRQSPGWLTPTLISSSIATALGSSVLVIGLFNSIVSGT